MSMPESNLQPTQPIPSKRSFAELFFPARTETLRHKARSLAFFRIETARLLAHKWGFPTVLNAAYIRWLEKESMLANAVKLAQQFSGKGMLWRSPYAKARPRHAIGMASVWFTAYPMATITNGRQSILETYANREMWQALKKLGIKALHTGPMKQAGGLHGWSNTPSIDGHYDRISTKIDPLFGTSEQYQHMSQVAAEHGSIIIDDLIPGHTGKGADFALALMRYKNYPGIYHMVEIEEQDWHLLPEVPKGHDSINLNAVAEEALKKAGYIIGKFSRVIFYEPGVKETNWSATRPVRGVDGVKRRWVYLHYFKDGQPSINWLDPSFAGMQLVVGDALHSVSELGAKGLRLDANGFLGAEISAGNTPAWSEGHPLSAAANQLIAGMVRKVGSFTFQELNLSLDDIKATTSYGADLSYDFINRPAYHHALATSDTEFLRLMLRQTLEMGIDPAALVHALQNHDELTYELVHFWDRHREDTYGFRGKVVTGRELRHIVRRELRQVLLNNNYNQTFTENGIACTTTSVIAATLGYKSVEDIDTTAVERIKQAHLLLAKFNAWQPGVFALSGWDLTGSFMLSPEQVTDLIKHGDTRWLNRGAYDLMSVNPAAKYSSAGIPKAISLYGSLPDQLQDRESFALQLKKILDLREKYKLATSYQVAIPDVHHKGVLVMVHQLKEWSQLQLTVLNFSNEMVASPIHSEHLPVGASVIDMMSNEIIANIDTNQSFLMTLEPHHGYSLLVEAKS